MAFIYRYQINNKQVRKQVNLSEFKEQIIKSIEDFFSKNLKHCRVEENFYEYKLHFNATNQELREFGRRLLNNCSDLRDKIENIKPGCNSYFVRMQQQYYAFIEKDADSISEINLIDVMDFNDLDRFTEDALKKLASYLELNNKNIEDFHDYKKDDFPLESDVFKSDVNEDYSSYKSSKENHNINYRDDFNNIARAFYMDVFNFHCSEDINNSKNKHLKKLSKNEVVLLSGYHKRDLEKDKLISEVDVDKLKDEGVDATNLSTIFLQDGFAITNSEIVKEEDVKRILATLNLYLNQATAINKFNASNYKTINFTVHNVGQALCTSLSENKKPPFLYFDFGISEGRNSHTLPSHMTVDVSNNPSIIISHIHRDHWYGMTKFIQAFQCDWYIPAQNRGILFQKRCAEIIASGGSINIINSSIVSNLGTIFTHCSSTISTKTAPKGKHETGLSMKLKLHSDTNSDVNILVPGDQVYDYIPSQHLNDIDILVATHHGGTYTKPKAKFNNIPISAGAGTIIYSYGHHNTYGHPSKLSDYQSKGWTTAHNTYSNLDFSLK